MIGIKKRVLNYLQYYTKSFSKRGMTTKMALKLAKYFGTTPLLYFYLKGKIQ
ncbi:MAG: hypothetical protein QM493_10945 [Sulfurovum sp.]